MSRIVNGDMQYDYLIVGSGLTGATLAHLLTEAVNIV